ncbi:MAG TPA: Rrf2 family transcriptional regulator [Chitinophagales bacterium]|jgi:Rrf2 family iron-sulfur cluster assembly transcriptional regulator|nr:Rrf2 family transcriptional regulator [Chitinophagales bacterium]MBP6153274.1 Rrf2 family transcriptional regulator [Chitinophagales bacterium]HQV78466.1 Rrf2 family transcriptional regulator [Chitinophagales bacterium]HQW78848.1 Rrf2 family transcriptional regulator [Chitinophagales bacterium]HRB67097.1 Rrf2 family transcriptional regulator [Chitinophagales bacterium]
MFSKACEYGIKAVVYIAIQSKEDRRVKIGDIAENTGTPEAFTAKVLGTLTKQNLVESIKGPYGGFEMTKAQREKIKLSQIVKAIDGDAIYKACSMGMAECSDKNPCLLHHQYVNVRMELKKMLESTTIEQLAIGVKSGKTILNGERYLKECKR